MSELPGRADLDQLRRQDEASGTVAGVTAVKSWQEMRDSCARLLHDRTGQDVGAWRERISAAA